MGEEDGVISEELFDESSRSEYTKFLKARISEKEINNIRKATKTGKPLGNRKFIMRIGRVLKRHFLKSTPEKPLK